MAFEAPSAATESVKVADLNGKLLILEPVEFKTGIGRASCRERV